MSVNGPASAQTMLGFRTWRPGYCLEAVWQAFKRNGARTNRSAQTATAGWYASDGKHPGDRNPPAGVAVWWGPRAGSAAGDVVISLGGGRVVATDWPYNGVIGVTTLDARERQIRRPYFGWTESIFDVPIDWPGKTPGPAPIIPKEDGMAVAIRLNKKHLYTMDDEFISHAETTEEWDLARRVNSINDEAHDLNTAAFLGYLDAMGIPRDVVRYQSDGWVRNPETGLFQKGGVWSRDRQGVALAQENAAAIARLEKLVGALVPVAPAE